MIQRAYVMPHPPIILPEVGRGEEKKVQATLDAMERAAGEIAEMKPDLIVLSSPHAPSFRDGFYLAGGEGASGDLTNFGIPRSTLTVDVAYDLEFAEQLREEFEIAPIFSLPDESKQLDHGSLIPLRFIQDRYAGFKVIILGLSGQDAATHFKLGEKIKAVSDKLGRKTVYIASGDLSHVLRSDGPYGYKPEGPKFDEEITEILREGDWDRLLQVPENVINEAAQCGIRSFQIMAGALGTQDLEIEQYSYEGTFGVGYAVTSFLPSSENLYVKLARSTIEHYITNKSLPDIPDDLPQEMREEGATFVTLHKDGELRGCIGTIEPTTDSVAEEIQRNAIASATQDPRFPPVQAHELDNLEISVDILFPAEVIDHFADLDPARYGVIVTSGFRRGLLLPRLEGIDDAATQVHIALQKAGLSPQEPYRLERFEVIRHE